MQKSMKWLATVTLCLASPAIAGEITGTGDPTPVHGYVASSICSFSGLNDDGLGPSTQVQAWGAFVRAFGGANNVPFAGPGTECRGN
jgi:hypothetical protein